MINGRIFGTHGVPDRRVPLCYVLIVPAAGAQAFGPFEDEDNATAWAAEHLPERVLFSAIPVYDQLKG